MKSISTFAFLILAFTAFAQNSPTQFKSEIDFGGGTVFSTFFDVVIAKNGFAITSPKNADVRMFGGKARLGRVMGKSPKKGIIINITGQQRNGSLFGETTIPMFGKLKFKGTLKDEILSGALFSDDSTSIGTIKGVKSQEKSNDYSYLYPRLLKTIEENIYSREALQSKEWRKFQKEMEELCNTVEDDIELFLGFNILTQSLPFTHLNLLISEETVDAEEGESTQKTVVFEEKNEATAYLLIKNFSSSKEELAAILPEIVANQNYKNLIIDLRNNPGGGIDAAFEFAKHITNTDMEVGYFVTNKLQYSGYEPQLFATLPELQPKSTKAFTDELRTTSGVKLIFKKPANPVFTGNIYVLTNGNTGSTCEPIVYALKKSQRAQIIGEKTYGGMLAGCPFDVSGKYRIMLPIADFYTADGVRLDRVGVEPDIESDDALLKAMEIINGGKI